MIRNRFLEEQEEFNDIIDTLEQQEEPTEPIDPFENLTKEEVLKHYGIK